MTKLHNELSVIDRGENLVRRKKIYEALYPQTKRGGDRRSEDAKNQTPDSGVWSFNEDTHLKTGMSKSLIYENVQIANDIAPAVKDIIRDTDLADRKTDLLSISRVTAKSAVTFSKDTATNCPRSI